MADKQLNAIDLSNTDARFKPKFYFLWLIWLVWLPFFTPNLLGLFNSPTLLLKFIFSVSCSIIFFGTYLVATNRTAVLFIDSQLLPTTISRIVWLAIGVLIGLSCALVLSNGKDWLILFYYVAGYVCGRLPTVRSIQVISLVITLIVILGVTIGAGWYFTGQAVLYVCGISVIVISIVNAVATSRKLRLAQAEVARLAVTNERLRIARDLHDLLGHNLALIALKSELAGRLVKLAPEQAVCEIGDVEKVARSTLSEVREAVSNYRQPTLANELQGAQEVLTAAGIHYQYQNEIDVSYLANLPTAVESILAWTVREGVTNIVRHSRAQSCTIKITSDEKFIGIEIINDSATIASLANNAVGNGLNGLRERVAVLGGKCEAGICSDTNFRLVVSVPIAQK